MGSWQGADWNTGILAHPKHGPMMMPCTHLSVSGRSSASLFRTTLAVWRLRSL